MILNVLKGTAGVASGVSGNKGKSLAVIYLNFKVKICANKELIVD
jgi:hypothetical protein